MDIRLLGPLEVVGDDGSTSPVRGPVRGAVLAALALRVGRVVTAADLAAQVWGDAPPARPDDVLRRHLRELRRQLSPGRLERAPEPGAGGPPGWALRARPEEIDVGRARAALRHARQLAPRDPTEAIAVLDGALDQWRGAPLTGLGNTPLREREQPRLDDLCLLLRQERIGLRLALGEREEALAETTALAQRHPGRADLAGLRVLVLHRCGHTALALRELRSACDRFGAAATELRSLESELAPPSLPMPEGLDRRLAVLADADEDSGRLAAAVFPLLALAEIRTYSAGAVAALAGCSPREATAALERLGTAGVTTVGGSGSHALGAAERSVAARQAAALPEPRRRHHLAGLARWYLGSLYRVNAPLAVPDHFRARYRHGADRFPQGRLFTSAEESLPWADAAAADVAAFAGQLADARHDTGDELAGRPLSSFALEAVRALDHYFALRQRWRLQQRLNETVLRVADRTGDVFAEAVAHSQLGRVYSVRRESARGAEHLTRAVALFRSVGEQHEAVHTLSGLVPCLGTAGRLNEAVAVAEQALAEARAEGLHELAVLVRHNLARTHLLQGDHHRAHPLLTEGYAEARLPHSRMLTAGVLAEYHLVTGEYARAAEWADRALGHAAEQPFDPYMVAKQRTRRAAALRGLGEHQRARTEEMQAEALLEDLNRREQSQLRLLPVGEEPFDADTVSAPS